MRVSGAEVCIIAGIYSRASTTGRLYEWRRRFCAVNECPGERTNERQMEIRTGAEASIATQAGHFPAGHSPGWPLRGMTGRLRQQQRMAVQGGTADLSGRRRQWRGCADCGPCSASRHPTGVDSLQTFAAGNGGGGPCPFFVSVSIGDGGVLEIVSGGGEGAASVDLGQPAIRLRMHWLLA
jgi:hypothetical protein